MVTETFLTYGQPEPPTGLIPLRAGPLTMRYDPTSGFVRWIKLGDHEVLRGIYAAVRDRNWETIPGKIREIAHEVGDQSFSIEFDSEHRQGDIHFVWRGILRGDTDGMLRYEFAGEPKTTFLRNRIGFCVLQPIRECAGARANLSRKDGGLVEGRFPELIEPQILGRGSFRDLRGMAHEVADGLWAELEFEGDTFEMEDQRNWTDASFKTYCTPLALPFPVEIQAGSKIHQAVTLRLSGNTTKTPSSEVEIVSESPEVFTLQIPAVPTARLPAIGLGVASHGEQLNDHEIATLRQLRLSHLRLDLRLATDIWRSKLAQAATEAEQLGARLELAIHLPGKGAVDANELVQALEKHASLLVRVLALREGEAATSPETLQEVRKILGGIQVPVGAGSDCNFCELNREQALGRLALNEADFLFWSINPQVHAFDHLSVMETLAAQAATVHSARAFAGDRPLVVSLVTLKPRFNPVATGAAEAAPPGELPPQVDPRQLSQFAAAWALGSLTALTAAKVESVTYFETTGWRGVMERAAGSPLPSKFPSRPGSPFPVFEALASLVGHGQAASVACLLADGVSALFLFADGSLMRIVACNQRPQMRTVRFVMSWGDIRLIELHPYQVVCLPSNRDGKC